jgi:HD-GYP domain-containing protein (c-di-GMP phosphodiesterase class II)
MAKVALANTPEAHKDFKSIYGGIADQEIEGIDQYLSDCSRDITQRYVLFPDNLSLRGALDNVFGVVNASITLFDGYTEHHIRGVEELCWLLGEGIGLDHNELSQLIIGAKMHDIGKNSVGQRTIQSVQNFESDTARREIQRHPIYGQIIFQGIEEEFDLALSMRALNGNLLDYNTVDDYNTLKWRTSRCIREHHINHDHYMMAPEERKAKRSYGHPSFDDGEANREHNIHVREMYRRAHPREELLLELLRICDACDAAMDKNRVYKKAKTFSEFASEVEKDIYSRNNHKFDPEIAKKAIAVLTDIERKTGDLREYVRSEVSSRQNL